MFFVVALLLKFIIQLRFPRNVSFSWLYSFSSLQEFVNTRNYPVGTQVTRVLEGMETNTFRRYFDFWEGKDVYSSTTLDGRY